MRLWALLGFVVYGCHGTFQQLADSNERMLASSADMPKSRVHSNPLLTTLRHWGRYAASTYQRYEDWDNCTDCQAPDIAETELNSTWSTALPAFSRGYVGIHHGRREVVVAFRGTTHIMDTLSDAQIAQVPWPPSSDGSDTIDGTSRVHWGFLLAYKAAQLQIRDALETIARDARLADYSLHFVGHSLGAAQATLAFVDYSLGYPEYSNEKGRKAGRTFPRSCSLVTFGSPRVGNLQFIRLVDSPSTCVGWHRRSDDKLDESVLRVVHESDIVPHLPRSMLLLGRYSHAGRETWARDAAGEAASEIIICSHHADDGKEDPQCSAGTSPLGWNILDHLVYPGIQLHILPDFLHPLAPLANV
ncbi:hypothetical protein H4R20_003308 [Coemansia guatemalensis]|uniref:Fungal lipase-type domain-containing protein n=1 Tax=Coemansia guatemalensis TaxID=2761395 RepID=A0A9W8LRI3_9FUNG|nr:hypothetical protein H4R20_003308 [Coemansia guatemalensis]